ncbi:hypothetical protein DRQ09_07415 [candidate division KSB1 bacterium]|nr:MAG: hypothetical protein DRQ09_07415 [candidate division KSB1 bacterium]
MVKDNKISDNITAKEISTVKGISGIFTILEKFFNNTIESINSGDNIKKRELITSLGNRMTTYKRLIKKGTRLINSIRDELDSLYNLLDNVPFLDQSFKLAQKGLKGISDLTEEATIKIQNSNNIIQSSLDRVNSYLNKLDSSKFTSSEDKEIFENCIMEIKKVADISFNIMLELQFQDILRQQLSAINAILFNTKLKIANSIKNITGVEISIDKSEESFVATDKSVLSVHSDQDNVDKILSEGIDKK